MNKKLMIFLVFIVSAASIILVASFGVLPENSNLPSLDSIEITNEYELKEGDKVIYITEDEVNDLNPKYTIYYKLNPENSKNDIRATSNVSGITVLVDWDNSCVNVRYGANTIGTAVTVEIYDAGTNISDSVTLLFRRPGEVEV